MIFQENLTSKCLQKESHKILKRFKNSKKILEVGCGDGNISNFLIKNHKKMNNFFHLSDISKQAINIAKKKLKYKKTIFKVGAWLDPWLKQNEKFDVIISDVSSINDTVANLSPWYNGIACDSGEDGLRNIKKILMDIDSILKKNSIFILPIISLCNTQKLNSFLIKKFNVRYSEKLIWPLPPFFIENLKIMKKLKNKKNISFNRNFNIYTAYTRVAICKKK
tara:strand:+ start:802 stop:1467 length:666 start_codon:yes stop_codon:yes gene_type:complete